MLEKFKTITEAKFFNLEGKPISFENAPRNEEIRISGKFSEEALIENNNVQLEKAKCILTKDGYVILNFTNQKFSVIPEEMLNIENAIDIKFESFIVLAKDKIPYDITQSENITLNCKNLHSRDTLLHTLALLIHDPNLNVFLKGYLYNGHYNANVKSSVIYTTPITEITKETKNGKRKLFVKTSNSWYRLLNV